MWHVTRHVAHDKRSMHTVCTRLHLGHMRVRVGDGLWCSEEIVKNVELHFSMRLLLLLWYITLGLVLMLTVIMNFLEVISGS